MLLVSSPMERKVSFIQLKDFQSVEGTAIPIVDAGLSQPYGLAWDAPRSALYICDHSFKKIFRLELTMFKCQRQCKGIPYQIRTKQRTTVVEGVSAKWAAVDEQGDLYFTDESTNSVNMLSGLVIEEIVKQRLLPRDLSRTTEAESAGEESVRESMEDTHESSLVSHFHNFMNFSLSQATKPMKPAIHQLYEKGVCPNVGTPAGIVVSGSQLFWTNGVGGTGSGSLVAGQADPRVKKPTGQDDMPTFPSRSLTNVTSSAFGVALTNDKIMFSDAAHIVWATNIHTGHTVAINEFLAKPRGIVWDGENTIYVADQGSNKIVSMPVGLLKENAPLTVTAYLNGPFGVAHISKSDPIWDLDMIASDGSLGAWLSSLFR